MLSIKIQSRVIVFLFHWFQACVPTLVDISLDKDTGEAVCLSSLQALTNLSVTSDHHGHYTRLVSRLYELFSEDNTSLQLQALKILINLSCNPDMVPHLLAAKVGRWKHGYTVESRKFKAGKQTNRGPVAQWT